MATLNATTSQGIKPTRQLNCLIITKLHVSDEEAHSSLQLKCNLQDDT